jgi:hypothetical protein
MPLRVHLLRTRKWEAATYGMWVDRTGRHLARTAGLKVQLHLSSKQGNT